jgi:hypothetical protein
MTIARTATVDVLTECAQQSWMSEGNGAIHDAQAFAVRVSPKLVGSACATIAGSRAAGVDLSNRAGIDAADRAHSARQAAEHAARG